jgi:hypothetical protein
VVGDTKFPGIGKIDGQDLARLQAGSHQAAGQALHGFAVFLVREAAVRRAGTIYQGQLSAKLATSLKDGVVEEDAVRISVEAGAHEKLTIED